MGLSEWTARNVEWTGVNRLKIDEFNDLVKNSQRLFSEVCLREQFPAFCPVIFGAAFAMSSLTQC